MIEDRLAVIEKENTFAQGWALFERAWPDVSENRSFRPLSVREAKQAITFADRVDLILSGPYLHRQLTEEMLWARQYLKIYAAVRDSATADEYAELKFDRLKIDESVSFSYLCVRGGGSTLCAFIGEDGLARADETADAAYFGGLAASLAGKLLRPDPYAFLKGTDRLLLIGEGKDGTHPGLKEAAKARGVPCDTVLPAPAFAKETADRARETGEDFYVSETAKEAAVASKGGRLYRAVPLPNGAYSLCEIGSLSGYVGETYRWAGLPDEPAGSLVTDGLYVCSGGRVRRLEIAECKTVRIKKIIPDMGAFLRGEFDSSAAERHNDYAAVARRVRYEYTLVPPLAEAPLRLSGLYAGILACRRDLEGQAGFSLDDTEEALRGLGIPDGGLDGSLRACKKHAGAVLGAVADGELSDFSRKRNAMRVAADDALRNLIPRLGGMYARIAAENSDRRFQKMDEEIAETERLAAEKRAQAGSGSEAIKNRQRAETLEKKAAERRAQRKAFAAKDAAQAEKGRKDFEDLCKSAAAGTQSGQGERAAESISGILSQKDSKEARLRAFAQGQLPGLYAWLSGMCETARTLQSVPVPDGYTAYEQDGRRFILIREEDEYEATEAMRRRFSLECFAAR